MGANSSRVKILAVLIGLLAVAAIGAWVLMTDTGHGDAERAPVRPAVEVRH